MRQEPEWQEAKNEPLKRRFHIELLQLIAKYVDPTKPDSRERFYALKAAYYVLEDETKRVLHVLDELEQELDPMYGIMRKAHGY